MNTLYKIAICHLVIFLFGCSTGDPSPKNCDKYIEMNESWNEYLVPDYSSIDTIKYRKITVTDTSLILFIRKTIDSEPLIFLNTAAMGDENCNNYGEIINDRITYLYESITDTFTMNITIFGQGKSSVFGDSYLVQGLPEIGLSSYIGKDIGSTGDIYVPKVITATDTFIYNWSLPVYESVGQDDFGYIRVKDDSPPLSSKCFYNAEHGIVKLFFYHQNETWELMR